MLSYELCCDMIDVVIDVSCIYGLVIMLYYNNNNNIMYSSISLREEIEGCAYDNHSVSIIRLTNGTILYLREVNRFVY